MAAQTSQGPMMKQGSFAFRIGGICMVVAALVVGGEPVKIMLIPC